VGNERVAAIKVMRHDFGGDEQALHMFLDEAKLLSRLSHPNIIQTLEFGTTGEHPFIAMELLLGRNLMDVWDKCVEQGIALRFDLAAWAAARVADALHHAHELTDEAGGALHLIHRDVNPSNVFLTFDGKVKLFDFGLAKASSRRQKSTAGIVKGKLPYLSPEQIMELPLDPRSDVYTLGTTLWEMTTMRRLFKRDSDVDTVRAVRSAAIPDPQTLVSGYPEPLARIVRKSLERNREHRYQTARDFAADLDAYLARVGSPNPSSMIPAILDRLFPGERARQIGWLKAASSPLTPRSTMTPPIPIPIHRAGDPAGSVPPVPPSAPPKTRK
jgi:serine/threonine-protein kinase